MKKLILALALVLSSLALQACESDCVVNLYGELYDHCPVPGSYVD